MKRMLGIFLIGVVMFGASAGASWYLNKLETERAADSGHGPEEKGHGNDKVRLPGEPLAKFISPASTSEPAADAPGSTLTRPSAPSAESVAQLAATLRQQEESVRAREQNLLVRQKHLDVIHQDLRNERKALDELRQQVNEEMKALTEKMDSLERKNTDLDKKKQDLGKQAQEVKQTIYEVDSVEQKSIKRMATTFDAMDADTAGELLQQMADGGKIDMAAKILATMQERQAARVFAQMQDRGTVVQLLDRMKGLRRPSAGP